MCKFFPGATLHCRHASSTENGSALWAYRRQTYNVKSIPNSLEHLVWFPSSLTTDFDLTTHLSECRYGTVMGGLLSEKFLDANLTIPFAGPSLNTPSLQKYKRVCMCSQINTVNGALLIIWVYIESIILLFVHFIKILKESHYRWLMHGEGGIYSKVCFERWRP